MENISDYKPRISREEIDSLPIQNFSGKIYFVDTMDKFNKVFPLLEKEKLLGFDTETKPSFKKGVKHDVSLLQLSTGQEAFIYRLNKIGLPRALVGILADARIKKVGLAIHDDIAALKKLNHFHDNGFIELQTFVKDFGIVDNGLKKIAANVMGIKISKRQQTSNWEQEILSEAQIEYAATDAWVCYEIYNKLVNSPS